MNTITVVYLALVILTGNGVETQMRPMKDEPTCKAAETAAREAVEAGAGIIDVGTKCLVSEFDVRMKPRA